MTDEAEESLELLLLPKPNLTSPSRYSTVGPGFLIEANAPWPSVVTKWNLDIVIGGIGHRFSPSFTPTPFSHMWFRVPVDLIPPGPFWFQMEYQSVAYSGWTTSGDMTMLVPPPIITNSGFVSTTTPEVRGTGVAGATVKLYQAGSGAFLYGTAQVDSNNQWKTTLTRPLDANPFNMTAHQTLIDQTSGWAQTAVFVVLRHPAITNPGTVKISRPEISGTGEPGATIKLYRTGSAIEYGRTTVQSNRTWKTTLTTDLPMGDPFSMGASQELHGQLIWAQDVTFTVLYKPVIEAVTVSADRKPTISGRGGFPNARLEIWFSGGGGVQLQTTVQPGGGWSVSATTAWNPDQYHITARQLGPNTGRDSDWAVEKVFSVVPSKPAITQPPSPAEPNQQLTITGVYSGIVTLRMQDGAGNSVTGSFSGSGTTRTFTPNPTWVPGSGRTVKVLQTVNNVDSDPSEVRTFSVKPPKPAITQPSGPVLPNQTLTITGVYSGTVTLKMQDGAGSPVGGSFSGSGTTRTFTPNPTWVPGSGRTVKVVQTVNNVDSDPSDVRTFGVKPPKPTITPPPSPAESRQWLTITGVSSGTVTLEMFNEAGTKVTGTFSTTGTTRTFTPTADWAPGTNKVKVVQTVGGVSSDESNPCIFNARPQRPLMEPPPNPAEPKQTLTITRVYSCSVTLKVLNSGYEVLGSFTGSGATRTFTPAQNWPAGSNSIFVMQTVNGVVSNPSPSYTLRVKPPKPAITPPPIPAEPRQWLTITGVSSGTVTLEMFNEAGTKVTGTFSTTGTTRTFTPTADWAPGDNTVKVVQTVNGVSSDASNTVTFKAKPLVPTISFPEHEGKTSGQLPKLKGEGYSGSMIEVGNLDETPVVKDVLVIDDSWFHDASDPWNLGSHELKVRQTFDGQASDWSDRHTFYVIPDQPLITEPEKDSETSPLPTIGGKSLAYADVTVRLKDGRVLFTQTADADGEWSGKVTEHLDSGLQLIEARQEYSGHVSEWSELHSFTVKKNVLKTPQIRRPIQGSFTSRKLRISGEGETGGQILLRYEGDPEDKPFATINGVKSWGWNSNTDWNPGSYSVRAQQTDKDGSSLWTDPARTFNVIDARFEFAEVGPVIGRPVVDNGESVPLQVQAVSTETGEGIEGLEVEWSADEQAVMATTVTGPDGWTRYRYTPHAAGEHLVLADLTNENEGVVVVQPFEVTALQRDAWAREFTLWLDGDLVDLAKMDLLLLGGRPHLLTLIPNNGSPLIGLTHVSLEDLHGVAELGLEINPPLGTDIPLREGSLPVWTITAGTKSGFFGLKLSCPKLPDRQLPGRVITEDLAEEVAVRFDTFPMVFGDGTAYPCHGATHTVTVRPKPHSLLIGMDVKLEWSGEAAADLGVVVTPELEDTQRLVPEGVTWTLNCVNSIKNGGFSLLLSVPELNFRSLELPMSLGHNKVKVIEIDGPRELGSESHPYWRYGIRVGSTFTGQAVGGVPVTVKVTGRDPVSRGTDSNGWIHVYYYLGELASFHIYNPYDGSSS